MNNDKVLLEQSMEMEEEGIVNRLQRQIGGNLLPARLADLALPHFHAIFQDLMIATDRELSCP